MTTTPPATPPRGPGEKEMDGTGSASPRVVPLQSPSGVLVRRLDGRAQFFDEQPLEAARSNLQKSADLFREAAREIERQRADKDAAYLERNQVVAALASVFPSGIARTDIPGWLPEWHRCVYIDLPTGQASWHYHDSQHDLFAHLPTYTKEWDGHTTPEKYARLAALNTSEGIRHETTEAKPSTSPAPKDNASRDDVLEEAAKVADKYSNAGVEGFLTAGMIARDIRSLVGGHRDG